MYLTHLPGAKGTCGVLCRWVSAFPKPPAGCTSTGFVQGTLQDGTVAPQLSQAAACQALRRCQFCCELLFGLRLLRLSETDEVDLSLPEGSKRSIRKEDSGRAGRGVVRVTTRPVWQQRSLRAAAPPASPSKQSTQSQDDSETVSLQMCYIHDVHGRPRAEAVCAWLAAGLEAPVPLETKEVK